MTPEQKEYLQVQERQTIALEKIAEILEQSALLVREAQSPPRPAPNYRAVLEEFNNYDWLSIGAEIEMTDKYGVASVIWNGDCAPRTGKANRYKRLSPQNSYGAVIFYSRCIGKDKQGNNQYERLITFEPLENLEAEPISRKAEHIIK